MKTDTRLLLKSWAWISLSINLLITSISGYFVTHKHVYIWFGIIIFIAALFRGIVQIWRDKGVNDLSTSSVIFLYFAVLFTSVVWAIYVQAYLIGYLLLLVAIIIEIAGILLIIHRYHMWNKFKKLLKKRK
jgi:hypothetical protein